MRHLFHTYKHLYSTTPPPQVCSLLCSSLPLMGVWYPWCTIPSFDFYLVDPVCFSIMQFMYIQIFFNYTVFFMKDHFWVPRQGNLPGNLFMTSPGTSPGSRAINDVLYIQIRCMCMKGLCDFSAS